MLELQCDVCKQKLQEPGGLVFSPPAKQSWMVEKYHVCTYCWPVIRALLNAPERTEDLNN